MGCKKNQEERKRKKRKISGLRLLWLENIARMYITIIYICDDGQSIPLLNATERLKFKAKP